MDTQFTSNIILAKKLTEKFNNLYQAQTYVQALVN